MPVKKTITIISKRRIRFQHPDMDVLRAPGVNPGKQVVLADQDAAGNFGEWGPSKMYFDSKPGKEFNFGEPQEAPAWIKDTNTWALFSKAQEVIEVNLPTAVSSTESQVAAAARQAEAAMSSVKSAEEVQPAKPKRSKKLESDAAA